MNVEGTRSFAARRDTVWRVLNDPRSMAELMPGVESFDVKDDRHWVANVKIPLGLGGLRMKIDFDKVEERAPEHARLHAKGQGVGALMDMTTQFDLSEEGTGTSMRWQADVKIAGAVGSMGQRVLQPIVNQQVQAVLNALEKQVNEAEAESGGGGGGGESPSTGAGDTGESSGPSTGAPGTLDPESHPDVHPHTDPTLHDEGPPAPTTSEPAPGDETGSSGAEEGISPWAPESYEADPDGPTQSTEDKG